jgi:uncharacterized RDD family membrane protein YckC
LSPGTGPNPYSPPDAAIGEPRSEEPALANRSLRFAATLIDDVLYYLPILLVSVPLLSTTPSEPDDAELGGQLIFFGLSLSVGLTLYQAYLISSRGQSLGKRWMGIRIVREDGGPVDFVSVLAGTKVVRA